MVMASNTASTSLAAFDGRPFFDKALRYGVAAELITPGRLEMELDFLKKRTGIGPWRRVGP